MDQVTGRESLANGAAAVMSIGVGEVEPVRDGRPVWDEVSFTIAEAIRNGDAIVRVPVPQQLGQFGLESPSVGHWLDQLRRDVPFIHIELHGPEAHQEAETQIHEEGTRLIDQGRRMVRQGGGGETLHEALTGYTASLQNKHRDLDGTVNPTGTTQVRQVEFLKETFPDCQLADLDTAQVNTLQDILAMRPGGKRVERIAARTARNYIKQFRHFIRWLNMAPGFAWKRPADLEFTNIRIPETPAEKSVVARKSRVQTYTREEIQVLWEYASPLKRLLLLLGLNCGFDAKMIATLQPEDVQLRQQHPHADEVGFASSEHDSWIFRLRNKTSVYGEWKLWPVTVQAIEWWIRQREQIEVVEGVSAFLVNRRGRAYDTPTAGNDRNVQIPNLWRGLTATIRNDEQHKDFRELSFGKLRKTAGNLIRRTGDGEVAGVFLCHGQPVAGATDDFDVNGFIARGLLPVHNRWLARLQLEFRPDLHGLRQVTQRARTLAVVEAATGPHDRFGIVNAKGRQLRLLSAGKEIADLAFDDRAALCKPQQPEHMREVDGVQTTRAQVGFHDQRTPPLHGSVIADLIVALTGHSESPQHVWWQWRVEVGQGNRDLNIPPIVTPADSSLPLSGPWLVVANRDLNIPPIVTPADSSLPLSGPWLVVARIAVDLAVLHRLSVGRRHREPVVVAWQVRSNAFERLIVRRKEHLNDFPRAVHGRHVRLLAGHRHVQHAAAPACANAVRQIIRPSGESRTAGPLPCRVIELPVYDRRLLTNRGVHQWSRQAGRLGDSS